MNVSIFTPTHNTEYLGDLYDSFSSQDFYEWVIITNGGAEVPANILEDERVKVFPFESTFVGALKRYAVEQCTGDILLEVDHDDLLTCDALGELQTAFRENPDCGFVYSNCANFRGDFEKQPRYREDYGWQYRDFEFNGHILDEVISHPAIPTTVSRIWFAPNHLRAWTREAYEATGGYNAEMRVLDDQELMSKTYCVTKMFHIDKCLYLYRITDKNTWLEHNQEIQDNMIPIHNRFIIPMAKAWADRESLLTLDLGSRFTCQPGFLSVDLQDADVVTDLNETWPWEDNSVGVIIANDILEHLAKPLHAMKEAYRVLKDGGLFLIQVPSTDGRGAFQDPTHVSFWNENSFWYYTRAQQARYIDTPVRFQEIHLSTYFPTQWHKDSKISYVQAHLLALKSDVRYPGPITI